MANAASIWVFANKMIAQEVNRAKGVKREDPRKLAEEMLGKATDLNPSNVEAYYALAMLCQMRGEKGKASEAWQKYLELAPAVYQDKL